jgi:uncharacterized coiled-coil protein SlyX
MSADMDQEVDLPDDRYDRLAAQPESHHGRPLRFATVSVFAMLLGVGSAFAWRVAPIQSTILDVGGALALRVAPIQSTLRTWSTATLGGSFIQPTAAAASAPSAAQPAASELANRIEGLSREIAALKQQIDQLNTAQVQSAKLAAEGQERLAALQQLMDQKTQAAIPQPPQPNTAAKEKHVASAFPKPKPRPALKPRAEAVATPLRLGPSSTAE